MNRTIVADFGNEEQYQCIIEDASSFLLTINEFIDQFSLTLNHHPHCTQNGSLTRFGHYHRKRFHNLRIWRIQCTECKATFTVLPSFLTRYHSIPSKSLEKAAFAYHGGLSFENCSLLFDVPPLSLYSFLCSLGKTPLVPMLSKTGLEPPEDFQVDEKHSKCLGEKAYIPLITEKHVIWHIGYTESLEERKLKASYQEFKETACVESPDYSAKQITCDGFNSTMNALKAIFSGVVLLLCWLHTLKSLKRVLEKHLEKSEAYELVCEFFELLKTNQSKKSLKRIGLRSGFNGYLKKYQGLLGKEGAVALKEWFKKKKENLYNTIEVEENSKCFSFPIDQICNHLDRKLFMMKHFHREGTRKKEFLRGFALIHNLIPYQRFAKNANLTPVEASGGRLPHPNWFLSLMILTSGGYTTKFD